LDEQTLVLLGERIEATIPKHKGTKEVEKDQLVEILVNNVIRQGTHRVLNVLKNKSLKELVSHKDVKLEEKWQELSPRRARSKSPSKDKKEKKDKKDKKEEKQFPSKNVMVKVLFEHLEDKNLKEFLEGYTQKSLLICCGDIDDLSAYKEEELNNMPKKDLVKALLNNVNSFGIGHLFQALTVQELKDVCERIDLNVESSSKDKLVESIIEHKSFVKETKSKPEPSSKKPDIKKGVSKVDLQHFFSREELEKFLKERKDEDPETLKEMKISGKKTELVDRVLKFLEGDIESIKKKKGGRGKRKRGSSKSRSDVSEEGSKDEEEEEGKKKRKKNKD